MFSPKKNEASEASEASTGKKIYGMFQKEDAAKIIQKRWREARLLKKRNSYAFYDDLIPDAIGGNPSIVEDVSRRMFGRRIAMLSQRFDNPSIGPETPYYRHYTETAVAGDLLYQLMQDFNVNTKDVQSGSASCIAVSVLQNAPILDILKQDPAFQGVSYISDDYPCTAILHDGKQAVPPKKHSIGLLYIPASLKSSQFDKIIDHLRTTGLVASPWDIALNAANSAATTGASSVPSTRKAHPVIKSDELPSTKLALLEATMLKKMTNIANNKAYPTDKLAKLLLKLVHDLPDDLNALSIKRIALLLDLAGSCYKRNYPQFACMVYAVVHEISLSILQQENQPEQLAAAYDKFWQTTHTTLVNSLNLDEKVPSETSFVAAGAMSGSNAFTMALKFAMHMENKLGHVPTIHIVPPFYYEFAIRTQSTAKIDDADIFLLSAGPIANGTTYSLRSGVTPGVDINKFVRRHIIETHRNKPATLIVDTTTALYKNLILDADIQALVNSGDLSILCYESHQKFGLAHTDQAQCGRVFGCVSPKTFTQETIRMFNENGRKDFNDHVDIRIGAHLGGTGILEEIKTQHFSNGSLLRTLLMQSSLQLDCIYQHPDMLVGDENYFILSEYLDNISGVLMNRQGFGHHESSITSMGNSSSPRLSVNASDDIDTLILVSHLFINLDKYDDRDNSHVLEQVINEKLKEAKTTPSIADQIILIAMMNQLVAMNRDLKSANGIENFKLFFMLDHVITTCKDLSERSVYVNLVQHKVALKKELKESILFSHTLTTLALPPDAEGVNIDSLIKSQGLTKNIFSAIKFLLNEQAISTNEDITQLIHDSDFCRLINACSQSEIPINPRLFQCLKEQHPCLNQLIGALASEDSVFTQKIIDMIGFNASDEPLSEENKLLIYSEILSLFDTDLIAIALRSQPAIADALAYLDHTIRSRVLSIPKKPYLIATKGGPIDIMKAFPFNTNINHRIHYNYTLLSLAAENGSMDELIRLYNLGANLNEPSGSNSPLAMAIANGHVDIVVKLLELGANISSSHPLHIAVEHGHTELVSFFMQRYPEEINADFYNGTPLVVAVKSWIDGKVIDQLLQHGALINKADLYKKTPLFLAVEKNCAGAVEQLCLLGADVNSADKCGRTPLRVAIERKNIAMINQLIESGADIQSPDTKKITPLISAICTGDPEVVNCVLQHLENDFMSSCKIDSLELKRLMPSSDAQQKLDDWINAQCKMAGIHRWSSSMNINITPIGLAHILSNAPMVQNLMDRKNYIVSQEVKRSSP